MANQVNLPSVGTSHSKAGLCEEVFSILLAQSISITAQPHIIHRTKPFFSKQVQSEDNSSSSDLKLDAGPSEPISGHAVPVHQLHIMVLIHSIAHLTSVKSHPLLVTHKMQQPLWLKYLQLQQSKHLGVLPHVPTQDYQV